MEHDNESKQTPPVSVNKVRHVTEYRTGTVNESTSSGSSNNSSRNNSTSRTPDRELSGDPFPDLVHAHPIIKKGVRGNPKMKLRKTLPTIVTLDEDAVTEEREESESEKKNSVGQRLRLLSDHQEFNVKSPNYRSISRREREKLYSLERCRSVDRLRLPRVEEAKTEDDERKNISNWRHKMQLEFSDKNEFNKDKNLRDLDLERCASERRYDKMHSLTSSMTENNAIPEDNDDAKPEKAGKGIFLNTNLLSSNISSNASSHHSSPRFRLKVDELDSTEDKLNKKNALKNIDNEINPIEEVCVEEEGSNALKGAKRLQEERDYIKKIVKGEAIEGDEAIRNTIDKDYIQVTLKNETIMEEDEGKVDDKESNQPF